MADDDPNAGWKGRGLSATVSTRAPFHMEGGKGTTSKVMKFHCVLIRSPGEQALSSLGAHELRHRPIRLADRVAVIHGPGEIGIREGDSTVRLVAQNVARRGLAVTPKKKPGCGFTYACPQRFSMIPAMSRRGSKPPGANMSPSCSRNARSYCANDVPSS